MKEKTDELYYGYRVVKYVGIGLVFGGIIGIALGITFTIMSYSIWILVLCWILGIVLLAFGAFWQLSMGFIADSKKVDSLTHCFSSRLESIWDGKGKVLDIGTGSGRIAIEIAKRFPEAQVIGVDIWTKMWSLFGQTRMDAERNAKIANVEEHCTFQYGSALNLPFQDGEFQLVVSNFTFHEINTPDRMNLFKEIARILAPSGTFLILDFFAGSFLKAYKVTSVEEFLGEVERLGFKDVSHEPLKKAGIDLGVFYRYFWEIDFLIGMRSLA
jgi:SAM-dependent methyltransferase